jgi:membrane-associated phospholipid phosphatase
MNIKSAAATCLGRWTAMVFVIACAAPASAQSQQVYRSACGNAPSFKQLFVETGGDFKKLASGPTLGIAAVGTAAAFGAHSVDREIERNLTTGSGRYRAGAIIGGTPFQLGAAFATYAIGHALNKPCAANLGADLIQAQLMAEVLTIGIKQATRRSRPEGTGYSFPSGHTTVSFASATVLQRHYGWKVGIPAYGVASFVAASRVEMKRHYLSDVAFGAALGIIAGRTVTLGRGHRLMLEPIAAPDNAGRGAGLGVTWIGKP